MYPLFSVFLCLLLLLFMRFVVVVCVISEAAGKAADRQKGKGNGQFERGDAHRDI